MRAMHFIGWSGTRFICARRFRKRIHRGDIAGQKNGTPMLDGQGDIAGQKNGTPMLDGQQVARHTAGLATLNVTFPRTNLRG